MRTILAILFLTATFVWTAQTHAQTSPVLVVTPDSIDFGRVHIGLEKDSFFIIEYRDTSTNPPLITLDSLNYQRFIQDSIFIIDSIPVTSLRTYTLDKDHPIVKDSVRFVPRQLGQYRDTIFIKNLNNLPIPKLILTGTGISSSATVFKSDFDRVRVDSTVRTHITIRNKGNDYTLIDSIIVLGSDTAFNIQLDSAIFLNGSSRPSGSRQVTLQYEGKDTAIAIPVQFTPRKLGRQFAALEIHTTPGGVSHEIVYDTIWGTGAEPYILAIPDTIRIAPITVTTVPIAFIDTVITIKNTGTFKGTIDSVRQSDTTKLFNVQFTPSSVEADSSFQLHVTFIDTLEGTFADTIRIMGDARYALYDTPDYLPSIILTASVRAGAFENPIHYFKDTIRTCDTVYDIMYLHNPYPIAIQIDTIALDSTGAGLSIPLTLTSQPALSYPIVIPTHDSFPVVIAYAFPPDSLNGPQIISLHLIRNNGELSTESKATVIVNRKRHELTLHAHLPKLVSSANDISLLDLPITIEGPREGVHELDAWTLSLTFSNDLFLPVALDTLHGLVTAHDTTPFSLQSGWDPATRTYTITVSGAKLSDPLSTFNDLLFKIRMRAFLTADTEVTVTPVLKFVIAPCAYTLHPFQLTIPYANDCGDVTVRAMLEGHSIPLRIESLWPNPVAPSQPVSLPYDSRQALHVRLTSYDGAGRLLGLQSFQLSEGAGTLEIPASLLPKSGLATVSIDAYSENGALVQKRNVRIAVFGN